MKIFDKKEDAHWSDKVNFVDKNNVLVGYDMSSCCCEHFGWFLSEKEEVEINDENGEEIESTKKYDLEEYCFNTDYFCLIEGGEVLDSGGMAIFKLWAEGKPNLYLHLFNIQNGYYGHGFTSKIQEEIWKEGTL